MRDRDAPGGPGPPLHIDSELGVTSANRDTEMFAEFIAGDAPRSFLDVGTGTGYLAIRLARGGSEVAATDILPKAKVLAERNARRNGVSLSVRISDLFENVDGAYDAIAFNPPFSARRDPLLVTVLKKAICRIEPLERALMHHMPKDVETFRRGLIERFLKGAAPHLNAGGSLYLLLYRQELPSLQALVGELLLTTHEPPVLRRRNLSFVRLTASLEPPADL